MGSPLTSVRRGFTLVELLTVITVLAVLIAMLLPAVSRAKEAAERVVCASNERQLCIATIAYTNDNRLYLPGTIFNWKNLGNRDTSDFQSCGQNRISLLWEDDNRTIFPPGVLVYRGYITSPKLLWCPSITRPDNTIYWNWDRSTAGLASVWGTLSRGLNSNDWRAYIGYADHFYVYADTNGVQNEMSNPGWYYRLGTARLDYVETYWNKRPNWAMINPATPRNRYSPAFFTCTMAVKPGNAGYPNGNAHLTNGKKSGFNAVFFDGSARWVSVEEMNSYGSQGSDGGTPAERLSFHYPLFGSGNVWLRSSLLLSKPF